LQINRGGGFLQNTGSGKRYILFAINFILIKTGLSFTRQACFVFDERTKLIINRKIIYQIYKLKRITNIKSLIVLNKFIFSSSLRGIIIFSLGFAQAVNDEGVNN